MQELIKIKNENGKQLVSARELHEFLEVGRDFTTWIKSRINKYDFTENTDFTVVNIAHQNGGASHGGQNKVDYAISVSMAKELSMVENNDKGRLARRYFIECEKVLKENVQVPKLSKELQAIFVLDNRTVKLEKRIDNIENNYPLFPAECDEITQTVRTIGVKLLGYKNSEAYNNPSLRSKVYSDIYNQLRREFQVRSYKVIKRCQLTKALEIINNYNLPIALKDEINQVNNQVTFDEM